MEPNQISRTALFTTYSRAYHVEHDSPVIFADPFAGMLLTATERTGIEEEMLSSLHRNNPAAAASFPDRQSAISWLMQAGAATPIVLARARYAEECLERAIGQGVTQYVILGAGLDSFAWRRPDLMRRLTLFEVDFPATQRFKRERLTELGLTLPAQLRFVPLDFTERPLDAALKESGYDPSAPGFFSWLGVTYYLPRQVVLETLRTVAAIATAGSGIVFDYLDDDAFHAAKASPRVLRMLWSVALLGEPMQAGFDPLALATELHPLGLEPAEELSPVAIQQRYFLGRTDHYRASEHAHFARFVVT